MFIQEKSSSQSAHYDAGLRSHMIKVYNYMCGGLVLSGLVALGVFNYVIGLNPNDQVAFFNSGWFLIATLSPLGLVFFMSFRMNSLSYSTLQLLYWIFVAAMGVSMSLLLYMYTAESVVRVFFITAAGFGALSLYGYTTKKDLSRMGSFLFMAVIGIVVASVVNIFLGSSMLQLLLSVGVVIVFSLLTVYDTQRIKNIYLNARGDSYITQKAALMGALSLYINFINLFQALLFLFGNRR